MSELHLGLLGIGVLVVAAVLLYNRIQESRLRRTAEKAFTSSHDDVLLGDAGVPGREGGDATFGRVEPTLAPAPSHVDSTWILDSRIDFIASFEAAAPVTGQSISAAIVDCFRTTARAVSWEGYNRQSANWEPLAATGEYGMLRAGLQLADRNGAASQAELDAFGGAMQEVAGAIGASCVLEDQANALQKARELDGFCADIDVQIGLNIIARGGSIAGTRIRALSEAHGLTLEEDGKFHRRQDAGLELFHLCNMEPVPFSPGAMKDIATSGLTLLFDVARAPGGIATFDRFVEFTKSLADSLSAGIVDDNRQPLDASGLGRIRAQLQGLYAIMDQHGIPAGSPLALRLFS